MGIASLQSTDEKKSYSFLLAHAPASLPPRHIIRRSSAEMWAFACVMWSMLVNYVDSSGFGIYISCFGTGIPSTRCLFALGQPSVFSSDGFDVPVVLTHSHTRTFDTPGPSKPDTHLLSLSQKILVNLELLELRRY